LSLAIAAVLARQISAELALLFAHEDRLVRSIAHEVRRPLQRVVTSADLGLAGVTPTEQALRDAARHAESLSGLFDDLVEVAQMLSGTRRLERQPVDLGSLVAEAEELLGATQLSVDIRGEG